jgi:hypothetical protein
LLDLEQTIAHLGGMLIAEIIVGETVSEEETKCDKWLESKLFSRGLEDIFLVRIVFFIKRKRKELLLTLNTTEQCHPFINYRRSWNLSSTAHGW